MSFADQKKNWNRLAEVDPMWAILSEPGKLGGKWDQEEFYKTGEEEADGVFQELNDLEIATEDWQAILDVGCGAGRVTRGFAETSPGSEVVGYDLSPEMINIAQVVEWHNTRYVLNETDDLSPFDDDSFDFVYCNRVYQHMDPDRLEPYLSEMVRVLKPGGVLWLQMLSHPTGDRNPERESSPLPEWAKDGELPQYTICCVGIDLMVAGFLQMGLTIHQARLVDGGRGQSLFSYEYICEKG